MRPDQPKEPERLEPSEPNNAGEEINYALCSTLVETNIAGDTRDAQLMMVSNQLLAPRNNKVMIFLGEKIRWASTVAILGMEVGPSLIYQRFALMACLSSPKRVKAVHLQSESSFFLEVKGMVAIDLQAEHLQREVGFLVVPELATNVVLEKALLWKNIEKISPKTGLFSLRDSSPVTIVDDTRPNLIVIVSMENWTEEDRSRTEEILGVVSRITELPPMSKTMGQVKTSGKDIQLVKTHKN